MSGRKPLVVAVVIAAVAVVGIGLYLLIHQKSHHQAVPPPSSTPAGVGGPGVTALKAPTSGLIDPFGLPPAPYLADHSVETFVALAYWSDLQTSPGGPIVHPNAIDRAIIAARAAGPDVAVKIRFFAGIHAPGWAKAATGTPISIQDSQGSGQGAASGGTIPPFWTSSFQQAYADVQAKLAAQYDAVPEVRDITISACSTIFAEPFIRQADAAASRQALLAGGYSDQASRSCLRASILAHRVWRYTHSSMAFNPYQAIAADGSWHVDEAFTEGTMDFCRAQLGARCVLENNSVRAPISRLGPQYERMYAHMHALGAPITFQTATPNRIGCLVAAECPPGVESVLDWATSFGATAVELPSQFDLRDAGGVLLPYDLRLKANAAA